MYVTHFGLKKAPEEIALSVRAIYKHLVALKQNSSMKDTPIKAIKAGLKDSKLAKRSMEIEDNFGMKSVKKHSKSTCNAKVIEASRPDTVELFDELENQALIQLGKSS